MHILLIGDSDIARWPKELLPSPPSSSISASTRITSGHSGATLDQIIQPIKEELAAAATLRTDQQQSATEDEDRLQQIIILVVCAGENDIGSGIPLAKSEEAFELLLKTVFLADDDGDAHVFTAPQQQRRRHLIFLGPKLEPWLVDDMESRKAYIQMSRSFARICNHYLYNSNDETTTATTRTKVHYVDCLTLFCDGANQPGALFGGRAIPQARYFDDDQLHLSHKGYRIWKRQVEERIQSIVDEYE